MGKYGVNMNIYIYPYTKYHILLEVHLYYPNKVNDFFEENTKQPHWFHDKLQNLQFTFGLTI